MTLLIYFGVALAVYLVFIFLEVTYCDLLEARNEPTLSHEAMAVMFASLIWPITLGLLAVLTVIGLGFRMFLFTKSLRPGYFHQRLGFLVSKCSKGISSFYRKAIRKCKEYKNVASPEGFEETSGQNSEGIEANIGGTA